MADAEKFEITVLQAYMPQALSEAEIAAAIAAAVQATGAKAMSDMGKVMAVLKPKLAGRADMGKVSALVKVQTRRLRESRVPAHSRDWNLRRNRLSLGLWR